ncbi:MAG: TIGR01212 family radical SAM protein [Bdellovibrionales bacterium RIFOXYC1_FULL_54_43]|nr:MAG: TIGR01212 family radical SAM protein [Bdellovibrionales bacterium RIFOXYC1_FULL_54_43]OFZ79026.1 MAG: TIGR01212 family radical SAM protein [Bdellovibrionales bacterium RIFOXYD1_FULL_55_31]
MEHYFPYSRYLKNIFGGKTYKIVVTSGLSCPTRDNSIASGGCAFCDVRASSSFFGFGFGQKNPARTVAEQIKSGMPAMRERFGAKKFLAYFQSYTNTYADAAFLRELYQAALNQPGIEGLCISTRPDCLPDPVLELLEELANRAYLSLELGVQSFEDETLQWLGRGHDSECAKRALERLRLRAPHVHVCVHLILGAPTDSPDAATKAARLINSSGARGAKLHQLMVLEGTELARRWRENPFPTLSIDQYADAVIEFIETLSPGIYIERLCATATRAEECLAPDWSRTRWTPHNRLREILAARSCRQGTKA